MPMTQSWSALGSARPTLAADLAGAGKRVAIVERHRFGGTCVNVGCIPTKALVASARAAHVARRAPEYGVVIDGEVRMVGWSSFPKPNMVCGPFRGLVRLEVEAADRESAHPLAREWDAAHPRQP